MSDAVGLHQALLGIPQHLDLIHTGRHEGTGEAQHLAGKARLVGGAHRLPHRFGLFIHSRLQQTNFRFYAPCTPFRLPKNILSYIVLPNGKYHHKTFYRFVNVLMVEISSAAGNTPRGLLSTQAGKYERGSGEMTASKKAPGKPAGAAETKRRYRKGDADEGTRERILNAATRVFAQHSFRAASTRMIAAEAGVDHPLIHYYFGSKEKLFEAVTEKIYREAMEIMRVWLEDISRRPPVEGLSRFVDCFLDHYFDHPEAQQIIFVNMAQIGQLEGIPSYRYILMHIDGVRGMLKEMVPLPGRKESVERLVYCFHILVDSFLGAKAANAQVLGMDPDGEAYKQWIRESLLEMFTPLLEKFVSEGQDKG
jgi:AcrR family transcriptional regulator